jgi:6-pyruvoyltetrahydropterin/6-carboxytetrahydropterin synthase
MVVELEGDLDARGMLMDFKVLKALVEPLVDSWDHAILVCEKDEPLMEVVRNTRWKAAAFPFDTTCENLCEYVVTYLCTDKAAELRGYEVRAVKVRIEETETAYAETSRQISEEDH